MLIKHDIKKLHYSTCVTSLPDWMSSGDDTEVILGASNSKRLSCRSFHLIPKITCKQILVLCHYFIYGVFFNSLLKKLSKTPINAHIK